MRISTNTLYESGTSRLSDLQARMMQTQQQIATGRRIQTPADDPVASARAYEINQAKAVNSQYATNRATIKDSLNLEENALQNVTSLLQDVKTMLVSAGNASYSDTERKFLATELRQRFDEMLSLANSSDGVGGYLFAGFRSDTQPFSKSSAGAIYNGDQGERMLQVSASRQLAFGDNGSAVFEQIRTGNGTFSISAASANAGGGVFSSGIVTNAAAVTGNEYSINFSVTGGVTTYTVTNVTTGAAVVPAPGNPYTSGEAIGFDGIQFEISGAPADGDNFSVKPSVNQSLFTTLQNLIGALEASGTGEAGQARLNNQLTIAHGNLDNALNSVLTVRANIGTRLKEIDSMDNSGSDMDLQYAETLSNLQDLDYAKAISSLVQQQTTLQAAQQSFVKMSGLSLFNFI
ncbi:flagellar hook-associated protein 3 FlgL [Paucimonas lemoignei]|uniref:Flagellar hook-associated protein 3 FlgL n=1 Tax=Paucimonas lemoignei TaxID=29443 RepID=A0A4R3I0X2_PAULE|nr:flagellar hook-associated protein FlgL [Paucimonas lemoignei]TCS39172.1 flagellar hook-associated protein 3 FlgL [Paucimonas lemoignei]